MTIQEMLSETMRIHDLLAAGDGPRTKAEWQAVAMAMTDLGCVARGIAEQADKPRPRMVDGDGLCSAWCPLFAAQEHGLSGMPVMGQCLHGARRPTRVRAPCLPWVQDQRKAHEAKVRELRRQVEDLEAVKL